MEEQAIQNNAAAGLFGEDDEDEINHQQIQQQQYQDDLDADDILGLDDDAGAMENPEGSLLMRFCPHDSSMLYPKVRLLFMHSVDGISDHIITTTHNLNNIIRKTAQSANFSTPAVSVATQSMHKGL